MSSASPATTWRPILGISMGDPAGIGPEIIAKALSRPLVHQLCRPIVVGDASVLRKAIGYAGVKADVHAVTRVADATFQPGIIDVFDLHNIDAAKLQLGVVTAAAGDAAFTSVRKVIDLANAGDIDGTVTAPIHKEALSLAGHKFPGHTEIFAKYTGTADYTMMLVAGDFRVVHVSTHVSLRQACDAVTQQRVLTVIKLAHQTCRQLGIANPTVGVAGLNPHASDGGLFGHEEREHITPAINDAKALGIRAEGPNAGDTFFAKASSGVYDICVAMYHDQGHIAVKMKGFTFDRKQNAWTDVRGINVSLGLPIIRASVDHGTAFDQAGKGTASDASMIDAIEYAAKLANNRGDKPS